jgi:hypothetical protein
LFQQALQPSSFTLDYGAVDANNLAENQDITQQHYDPNTISSFGQFDGGDFHPHESNVINEY